MTEAEGTRTGRASPALVCAVAIAAAVALATPQGWLTGPLPPDDPRSLALGAWLLRGTLLAIAALLLLAPRLERPAVIAPGAHRPSSRDGLVGIGLVVAVAAALRAYRLDAPLWFDEIEMLVTSVRPPLAASLRSFVTDNDHPLYSLLATLCVRLFGEHPWALRFPAAVFGVGSVAAVYVLGRDRVGRLPSLVAAAVIAVSSHHVWFSQNARGYSGLLLFTLLATHYLLRALATGRRRDWVLHGITLALCVMVHMTGAFTALGHVAVIGWAARTRADGAARGGIRAALLGLALATLVGFAAYALVMPQVVRFFLLRPDRVAVDADWTDPLWFLKETARSFGLAPWQGIAAFVGAGVVGLVGLRFCWRRVPAQVLMLVVPGVALAAAMLGLGRNLWPRLFFFLSGFAVLVVVVGLFGIVRSVTAKLRATDAERSADAATAVVGALLVVLFAATTPRAYALPKQDYGSALRYVASVRRADERVAAIGVMTAYVYREYFDAGYEDVLTLDDLRRAFPPGRSGYALHSFSVFVESRHPDVWQALQENGEEVARFPASVGGGDVVVLRIRSRD